MSYPMRSRPSGTRTDPFAALEAMHERMNRFFGDMFTGYQGRTPSWHPDIDINESGDGWSVEFRLPGVAPDEVAVDITDRELCVRSVDAEESGDDVRRFSYRLSIPANVDTERIDATMDHGLLTVHLPNTSEPRARRIAVGSKGTGPGIAEVPTTTTQPGEPPQ
jgi:HSP20 family protein